MRALVLALALAVAAPAFADRHDQRGGAAANYATGAWALQAGIDRQDPGLVALAHVIAQSVTLRPAPGWTLQGEDADAPRPTGYPRDPGDPAVAVLAGLLAEGDETAVQLVEERLATPLPHRGSAASRTASLAAGGSHVWRMAFFGASPAEAAVVLTGPGALTFLVAQEDGPPACPATRADPAAVCQFTPDRNGWFTVTLTNPGPDPVAYRLLTN